MVDLGLVFSYKNLRKALLLNQFRSRKRRPRVYYAVLHRQGYLQRTPNAQILVVPTLMTEVQVITPAAIPTASSRRALRHCRPFTPTGMAAL